MAAKNQNKRATIEKTSKKAENDAQESIDSPESEKAREERNRRREEERAKRRERRRKQVLFEKIAIVVILVIVLIGGTLGILWNLSSFRLSMSLAAGDRHTEDGDYEKAETSYREAIQIDPMAVEAYRCLAQNDMEQNDPAAAKEILYTGWEATQDESLLHYYCTIILNEAVAEINEKRVSFDTIKKCIQVLQYENDSEDAFYLLDTCYERLFVLDKDETVFTMFLDEDVNVESCQYEAYEEQLRSMLSLYGKTPSETLKQLIAKYAIPDLEYTCISVSHLEKYENLLTDVTEAVSDIALADARQCLAEAIMRENDFAEMFSEFAQGNLESAKEFIVSDTYVSLRDAFINGQNGYWEGASAIPINQDQMVIHNAEDGFHYYWPGYDKYENSQGVITVWGSKQLDDGVQRTTISYEPASKNGEYFPHTEYVIAYEYSNVLKEGTDVRLNYRLVTQVTTEEGATTEAIGDWGGEHEWTTSY